MKKKDVVILVSVIAAVVIFNLIFGSLYFIGGKNDRKHQAKEREFADLYRPAATDFVKKDPEMIGRYGADFDFELDYSYWYVQDDDNGAIVHMFQRLSGKYIPQSLKKALSNPLCALQPPTEYAHPRYSFYPKLLYPNPFPIRSERG